MDQVIQNVNSMTWKIDLETAIANGLNRLKKAEEIDQQAQEGIRMERELKWNEYIELIRSSLPEILRPLMRSFRDLQSEPPIHTRKEIVIIDGGEYGLAPIEAYLIRKTLDDPNDLFKVDYYVIYGIASSAHGRSTDYFFATGDECFTKYPEVERDPELLLAKAFRVHSMKLNQEFKAKSEGLMVSEPEYLPTGEDVPIGLVADKALLSALRAIMRDEMFRPPEA